METLPKVSEIKIRELVGNKSFDRGYKYFLDGAIYDTKSQGTILTGYSEGSSGKSYRVQVTFDSSDISEATCTCPAGEDGPCKHVAALLLTWNASPEKFRQVENISVMLNNFSKEELVEILNQAIQINHDLEDIVESFSTSQNPEKTIDSKIYKSRVLRVFKNTSRYDWDEGSDITEDIEKIFTSVKPFVIRNDFLSAVSAYETILNETLENYNSDYDYDGDLSSTINKGVEQLGECFNKIPKDNPLRVKIIDMLLHVYKQDMKQGGVGLADNAQELLVESSTLSEKVKIIQSVRAQLKKCSDWEKSSHGKFLLELGEDLLSDEEYLLICTEAGLKLDLATKLITLGRFSEAIAIAKQLRPDDLIDVANSLIEYEKDDIADNLIENQNQQGQNSLLLEWVKQRAVFKKDFSKAVEIGKTIFYKNPSLENYKELYKFSIDLENWKLLRKDLLFFLETKEKSNLLIEIFLDENQIRLALDALKNKKTTSSYYGDNFELKLSVAKKADEDYPYEAIDIYKEYIKDLINQRGRDKYKLAAESLKKVKEIYTKLSDTKTWEGYINKLRIDNHTLRALKEELKNAKI